MSEKKREEDYLEVISQSVGRVLGKKPDKITMDMLFKRDLGLSSLDVVDVGFELEQITGFQVRLLDVFLAQQTNSLQKCQDIYIRDIAKYLFHLSGKK